MTLLRHGSRWGSSVALDTRASDEMKHMNITLKQFCWWWRPVSRWLPPIFSWLGVALVLCLLLRALYFFYTPAYFYGIDEGGYLVPAKGLALRGDPAKLTLDSPVEFVGENMVEARPGVFYGKYPIGYTLLGAIAYRLGGPAAPVPPGSDRESRK